jgi:hypothetical protein
VRPTALPLLRVGEPGRCARFKRAIAERLENCNFSASLRCRHAFFGRPGPPRDPPERSEFNECTDPCAVSGVGLRDEVCSVSTAIGQPSAGELALRKKRCPAARRAFSASRLSRNVDELPPTNSQRRLKSSLWSESSKDKGCAATSCKRSEAQLSLLSAAFAWARIGA